MATPFLVTKPTKSVGLAILLTLVFGPIGLFYASVSGGLIMTFAPIFLLLLALLGVAQESSLLLGWSVGLLLIFAGTYWLITIICAIISVNNYNDKIEDDAKRQYDLYNRQNQPHPNQFVVNIHQKKFDLNKSGQEITEVTPKPNLQDWLKSNPGRTLNDYFIKFGR